MLIPGFTVEEVPVKLTNLNNLRFAPDGSLTALGYNGKVWNLRDTDGDGMEDQATLWWDKAPFTVPVGMTWSTHGLFVSSSGKVSLLKDTDGDGVADTEEVVASGWTEKDVASGNVDATGVTMDAEGNLYFGLLTANYANAYRLKKAKELTASEREWLTARGKIIPTDPEEEVSLYDLNGQRGSVQKWNARTRQLETIATGVRVPYQFAFNKAGALFMTDQEGETWMPNGNPLDELNHIVPGRNYGFPPRHEKWLPDLVSEPPVVGFGPQHQSACGFVFNEPRAAANLKSQISDLKSPALPAAPAQGLFGPKWWEGDAIVTGESRGKLWRVKLAGSDAVLHAGPPRSYAGEKQLIARLSMLTTDVAISPKGELYVSCHSGLPDWGTGPNGEGKIFRIRYSDTKTPQPARINIMDRETIEIAFVPPMDYSVTNLLALNGSIEFGDSVSAADRLEVLKPPYRVVSEQEAAPRSKLRIRSVEAIILGPQRGYLRFKTEPMPFDTSYALTIPGVRALGEKSGGVTVDLEFQPPSGLALPKPSRVGSLPVALFEVGDYETGRELFFSEKLQCATCHRVRGEGAGHGPDLSNLTSRDAASSLRDLKQPSATINPDYVGYNVRLRNGDEHSGFVRHEGSDRLKITSAAGVETLVNPTDVAEMRPAGVSLMPEGLLDTLNESQVNDLLTFLLHEPPKRDAAEARRLLGAPVSDPARQVAVAQNAPDRPAQREALRIVLVASEQDHGPGQHDYPAWQKSWHQLLAPTAGVTVEDAWLWPSAEQFATADAIIFYYWNRAWDDAKYAQLDAFQARGGGMVVLHSATIEDKEPEKLALRIGLAAQPGTVKYRHMPFDLKFVDRAHPILSGLPEQLPFLDEPYWPMIGDRSKIQVLANAVNIDGEDRPMLWTFEQGRGRVCASITGHYTWTLDDPLFRAIILRGLDWVTRSDRFGGVALK